MDSLTVSELITNEEIVFLLLAFCFLFSTYIKIHNMFNSETKLYDDLLNCVSCVNTKLKPHALYHFRMQSTLDKQGLGQRTSHR